MPVSENLSVPDSIRLLAAVEYFPAEVLELAGNAAKERYKDSTCIPHVLQALSDDEELLALTAALRVNFAIDPRVGTLSPGQPEDLTAEWRYER